MDFTLKKYRSLLTALSDQHYAFQTFEKFIESEEAKCVILRHDVDRMPQNALKISGIEKDMGIKASYHFRYPSDKKYEKVMRQIASEGHEVGYHYEEMSKIMNDNPGSLILDRLVKPKRSFTDIEYRKKTDQAFHIFKLNLDHMRELFPVVVISSHGSPLSRYDNRDMWKFHNYRDLGIICEVYFDIDYSKVLYLTDTGRSWNGDKSNIRDKPVMGFDIKSGLPLRASYSVSSTDDIIYACKNNLLPPRIVINTHPQRWNDNVITWLAEWVKQRTKNFFKKSIKLKETTRRKS